MKIQKATVAQEQKHSVILAADIEALPKQYFSDKELRYIHDQFEHHKIRTFDLNRLDHILMVQIAELKGDFHLDVEHFRKLGQRAAETVNKLKITTVQVIPAGTEAYSATGFAEGMALAGYQFFEYKKAENQKINSLQEIVVVDDRIADEAISHLNIVIEAVYQARDWVNRPLSHLNAVKLAEYIKDVGKESGARVEVLSRKKIEALKMVGLLAVNKGSIDPPTFSIMEWKPKNAVNEKPVVLVGKGVVFDTGGMNLKPGQYMNNMKMDMAGAATMANTLGAVTKAKLPVHVIALIPATDNRVNGNAYVTGDVVTMFDGTTVEVINTDAEGRMILADALSYAKKYDPQLVIDAATLTGSAARAIGGHGIVAMGNNEEYMELLKESGDNVYERIAEMPFWEEYAEELESDIADIKHLGGAEGGAIHAGKFLEHFTDFPYLHLDIAGVAYFDKKKSYHGKGGTGYGVRLLFDFFSNQQ